MYPRRIRLPVALVVVLALPMKIPIAVVIPAVIVGDAATISFPIAFKELLAIVTRRYPDGTWVRWPSPITFVPLVMASNRVPITFHPQKIRPQG